MTPEQSLIVLEDFSDSLSEKGATSADMTVPSRGTSPRLLSPTSSHNPPLVELGILNSNYKTIHLPRLNHSSATYIYLDFEGFFFLMKNFIQD